MNGSIEDRDCELCGEEADDEMTETTSGKIAHAQCIIDAGEEMA